MQLLVYLLYQKDSLHGQSSICNLDDVDLPMEYGRSKIWWNLSLKFSPMYRFINEQSDVLFYSLCSASNRTILLEFVRHHRPYECVEHTLPIDYGHRNNNYFQSIYFHIYLYRPKYQFSIHHAWKVKIKSNFIMSFEWWLLSQLTFHYITKIYKRILYVLEIRNSLIKLMKTVN